MAWNFGESFDLYTAAADATNGYWDSGAASNFLLTAGRFAGSQAAGNVSAGVWLTKTSGVNDPVHHLAVAFWQSSAPTGSNLAVYLELFDGATAQCSIVFRSDGAILLTSGGPTGTVLATYTGAWTAAATWTAFEFEVVINATTGSFAVRKNGNSVNDFSATGLDTQVSANAYANKLTVGNSVNVTQRIDDLFWRSGAAGGTWLGDIRCYTRWPASDVTDKFTLSAGSTSVTVMPSIGVANAFAAANAHYMQFTPLVSGLLTSATVNCNISGGGGTGHMKAALFADNAGAIGALLATSVEITNPGQALIPTSFPSPVHVARGQTYWLGVNQDANITYAVENSSSAPVNAIALTAPPYASWPVSNPGGTLAAVNCPGVTVLVVPQTNADAVSEAQQDAFGTYVFDSTPGDSDLYGIAALPVTPLTMVAVTTRGYMQKSDAGTRTAAMQLQSGATVVATPTLTLIPSGWQWAWRMDPTDPNTGAAWTAAAVNAAQIGPMVVA